MPQYTGVAVGAQGPAREQALAQIRRDLDEGIARGKVSREQAAAACARIAPEPELGRGVGQHGGG